LILEADGRRRYAALATVLLLLLLLQLLDDGVIHSNKKPLGRSQQPLGELVVGRSNADVDAVRGELLANRSATERTSRMLKIRRARAEQNILAAVQLDHVWTDIVVILAKNAPFLALQNE
jgi:hypothetical protein